MANEIYDADKKDQEDHVDETVSVAKATLSDAEKAIRTAFLLLLSCVLLSASRSEVLLNVKGGWRYVFDQEGAVGT